MITPSYNQNTKFYAIEQLWKKTRAIEKNFDRGRDRRNANKYAKQRETKGSFSSGESVCVIQTERIS